jgi:di/tricarboxylate transporter
VQPTDPTVTTIPLQQALFLLILGSAIVLFVRGRPRIDVTAMLVLLSLVVTGILDTGEALAGFTSEPAIIVASVFVMAAALATTGVTERIGQWISRASGSSEWRALLVIMPAVAVLAAFSHHLMITAMMVPIIMRFASEHQLPASRLLMPMSLAASLGTTLTVFSAPAFLLASDLLRRQGGAGLGIFDITPIGASLVAIGVLYVSLMRWIIPRNHAATTEQDYLRLERYYTELVVEDESPWTGKSLADFTTKYRDRLQLVDRLRDGERVSEGESPLQAGDVLLVAASPDEISSIKEEPGLELNAIAKYGDTTKTAGGNGELVQVVVGPHSEFAGRTIANIDFLRTLGVVVVGLWRKDGYLVDELSEVTLNVGDLLVLSGKAERYAELAQHRGFLMMVPFSARESWRHRAPWALGIMVTVIGLAATNWFPTEIVFLAGAVAMVLSGCVKIEHAYQAIDVRIFVMIAGVIPLGTAMEKTGIAQVVAEQLLLVSAGWSELALLALMFASASLLTQVLSDSATIVLIGPIAIAVATALGLPPVPFVVCTALGAVASFLTPIGHHGNLLVLGPGRYTFGDFLRMGLPLTVVLGGVSCWLARALWLGGPLWPGM